MDGCRRFTSTDDINTDDLTAIVEKLRGPSSEPRPQGRYRYNQPPWTGAA